MRAKDYIANRCYQRHPCVISKTIGDEIIIAIARGEKGDFDDVCSLIGVGSFIWGLIDGKRAFKDIKQKITEKYTVKSGQAQEDLISLLQQLENDGYIRQV